MQGNTPKGMYCCVPPTPGRRILTFPDGSQVGVMGLNEILSDMYAEGRQADGETAEEIVERLSENNYVTPSFKQQYCEVLIEEYRHYVKMKNDNKMR
jgi:hypothetical protein